MRYAVSLFGFVVSAAGAEPPQCTLPPVQSIGYSCPCGANCQCPPGAVNTCGCRMHDGPQAQPPAALGFAPLSAVGGCANGQCATPSQRRGLFGRFR